MYRDQFGEFVCGYWGLKGKGTKSEFSAQNVKNFNETIFPSSLHLRIRRLCVNLFF